VGQVIPAEQTVDDIAKRRQALWARWLEVKQMAEDEGVPYAPLGEHVTSAVIEEHGKKVMAAIRAKRAQVKAAQGDTMFNEDEG
jgi:hypothetical protein